MSFESERSMKKVATKALVDAFERGPVEVVTEFDYGPGRADLVFADISEKYRERRLNELGITESISDKTRLQTFLQLHGRNPVTRDYFDSIGALSKREKNHALEWLLDNDFVKEVQGKIRTAQNLRRHVTTTISAELKLSNWKRALEQAQRGRSFANYRYVVLDRNQGSAAVESVEMFEQSNVGLILLDADGDFRIVHEPARIRPYSNLTRWKLNEQTLGSRNSIVAAD